VSQALQTANTTKKCRLGAHRAPINKLGIDYHQYCSSSYLVYIHKAVPPSPSAMEIKLELDTDKTAKAAVAIAAAYALCRDSRKECCQSLLFLRQQNYDKVDNKLLSVIYNIIKYKGYKYCKLEFLARPRLGVSTRKLIHQNGLRSCRHHKDLRTKMAHRFVRVLGGPH
jgi:hypothetical protein